MQSLGLDPDLRKQAYIFTRSLRIYLLTRDLAELPGVPVGPLYVPAANRHRTFTRRGKGLCEYSDDRQSHLCKTSRSSVRLSPCLKTRDSEPINELRASILLCI